MAAPLTSEAFLGLIRQSGLMDSDRLNGYLEGRFPAGQLPPEPKELAKGLIQDGLLTHFQAHELLHGKFRGFTFGEKYKVLERLGYGRNSNVFLCEQITMRRKVVLKILPLAKAENPVALARFDREARAAGALHHPNIVHTYDKGREKDLHFLVMEYVDGSNLEEIVQKHGPMAIDRAAHYIRQAALGLQHLHEAGLIHRDIKPANLLLDRAGTIKVLDLGLARFFHDHQDLLTQQYDPRAILGTADYVSPEQAFHGQAVDTRTDVYSLGATLYFLLAGRPPFAGNAVAQKLLYHLTKEPVPLRTLRPEVPEPLAAVVEKMMAKDRDQRYQDAAAVVAALAPWTQTAVAPPAASEMPQLSPAAQSAGTLETSPVPPSPTRPQGAAASHSAQNATAKAPRTRRPKRTAGRKEPLFASPKQPPVRPHRVPQPQQTAGSVNGLSGGNASSDWGPSFHPGQSSRLAPVVRAILRRRKQLRRLAAVGMLAAILGAALGTLTSNRSALLQAEPSSIEPTEYPEPPENRPSFDHLGLHPHTP